MYVLYPRLVFSQNVHVVLVDGTYFVLFVGFWDLLASIFNLKMKFKCHSGHLHDTSEEANACDRETGESAIHFKGKDKEASIAVNNYTNKTTIKAKNDVDNDHDFVKKLADGKLHILW